MWQHISCLNGYIPFTSLATGMSPVIISSYPIWRSAEWLLVRRIKMLWLIAVSIGLNCLLETQYHTFRCQFSNVRILPCANSEATVSILFLIWAKNPQVTISAEVREHLFFWLWLELDCRWRWSDLCDSLFHFKWLVLPSLFYLKRSPMWPWPI